MLKLKVTQKDRVETIEEIDHAHINHKTGCMVYYSVKGHAQILHPDTVSQAFVMNENGNTVMSHNFVAPKQEAVAG